MLHLTLKDGEGLELRSRDGQLLGFVRVFRDVGRNRLEIDLPGVRVIRRKRDEFPAHPGKPALISQAEEVTV